MALLTTLITEPLKDHKELEKFVSFLVICPKQKKYNRVFNVIRVALDVYMDGDEYKLEEPDGQLLDFDYLNNRFIVKDYQHCKPAKGRYQFLVHYEVYGISLVANSVHFISGEN